MRSRVEWSDWASRPRSRQPVAPQMQHDRVDPGRSPQAGYGKPISDADIAPWNIDIRTSDGRGLPPGSGSVAQGKAIYDAKCVACHGADAKGGPVYGTMVGGIGSFTTNARVLTPGSMYPYAPILFDYIRRTMPMDRPQSLTATRCTRCRRTS